MGRMTGIIVACGSMLGAACLGVGYAIGTHKKMNQLAKKLDASLEDLAECVEIQIPDDLIEKYVIDASKNSVDSQVKIAISSATNTAVNNVRSDIKTKIDTAVRSEYNTLSETIKTRLAEQAAAIDIYELKKEVREESKSMIMEKLDDEIEKIRDNAEDKLDEAINELKEDADDKIDETIESLIEETTKQIRVVNKLYDTISKKADLNNIRILM